MGTSARPQPATADPHGTPVIPRILSPDEYDAAQNTSIEGLRQHPFPLMMPLDKSFKQPNESTRGDGSVDANPMEHRLTGLPRILTEYVASPILDHPLTAMATALIPGAGYAMAGLMGKDITEFLAQKAAEASLPEDVRKMAESDPNRIKGEQAAVEAVMLGAAPLIHGALKRIKTGGTIAAASPLRAAVQGHMNDVADSWNKIFAPANRSPEAMQAANILRATTGHQAAAYEQAAFKLDQFRRAIEPLPDTDKYAFIDAIEGGKSQPTPEFQGPADVMRKTLDDTREAIRALGTGKLEHFIDDYFPHIWAEPEKAMEAFKAARTEGLEHGGPNPLPESAATDPLTGAKIASGGKRPMEGSKAFLKERSIPTTAEGLALGLTPVSTNPVDLVLLKVREMQRYLMAHQSLNEMKENGLVKFVASGAERPEGYARISDKIATVFGPREGAVKLPEGANITPEQVGVPGMRIMGEYWAPEPVARVVNNYLSPGLRGNAIYDAYRGLGNTLNQAQLGLSAFHLGFTSMDASVSRAALGLEYLASGKKATGLAKVVSAPAAPVTNMMLGAKIRRAYLNPESATPEMQTLANAVKDAGGRVRMDSFYQNSAPERMVKAWKEGSYGKATALSLPALMESSMKPLMEHIVPMQKLGVFGDLAKKVLADLPPDATLADRRAALASAWDSVDNRMGQLVYDNLFWDKSVKDLAMASVRSVGWNVGTIRELGGGLVDAAKIPGKLSRGEAAAAMTHRAAYVAALPLTVGFYGALYQYLRTGEGPQELKDYFYPKTGEQDPDGNPERVQIASYMKDFFAYAGDPWSTVKHKLSPAAASAFEMLNNQDFYGDQIRNPKDPAVTQMMQEAAYLGKEFVPFSFRGMAEQSKRTDQSAVTKFGNWFGITPAPRKVVRTEAENLMAEMQHHTTGATPEQAAARKSRSEILAAMRAGNAGGNLDEAVNDAIERHQLTPADIGKLLKRAGTSPAEEKFKGLTLEQALQVFKAATPAEKAKFGQLLVKKVTRAAKVAAVPE